MNRQELIQQIRAKQSFLCVGLDTDFQKLPAVVLSDPQPMLAFNRAIIEATAPYTVAYKINTAFYESLGSKGWQIMEDTLKLIPSNIFTIADAKRGDIGNTSNMYARAFFEALSFDSVTLAPYMGRDSIEPFFAYPDKWGIVLALTSNPGSADYEQQDTGDMKLYERVIRHTATFTHSGNAMFVVGATKPDELAGIRKIVPDHFFLVPGVGAQGGSLEEVSKAGMNSDCGLLVNASRSIIYASSGADFAQQAGAEAARMAQEMGALLQLHGLQ